MIRARAGATVHAEPDLVEVEPGVWVVEDYHEPVFYSDGFYWRYYGGIWYRSSYHTGGWVVYRRAPRTIVSIRSPHTYVRYRASGNVRVRSGPRGSVRYRDRGPARRDHRTYDRAPARRGPAVRDHRASPQQRAHDRRDVREERREDRKDARKERKDQRKDDREDRRDDRKRRR